MKQRFRTALREPLIALPTFGGGLIAWAVLLRSPRSATPRRECWLPGLSSDTVGIALCGPDWRAAPMPDVRRARSRTQKKPGAPARLVMKLRRESRASKPDHRPLVDRFRQSVPAAIIQISRQRCVKATDSKAVLLPVSRRIARMLSQELNGTREGETVSCLFRSRKTLRP